VAAHDERGRVTRALITGITGQDGSYLAELLLGKGYEVHGIVRDPEAAALEGVELHRGDLREPESLRAAIAAARPDEVYNLGGLTSVAASWERPALTAEVCGVAVAHLLDALRDSGARVLQASSSEIFAPASGAPQGEDAPRRPGSPYGAAKLYGHTLVEAYRHAHGLHASSAILFSHESPRRPQRFVTRKIAWHAAAIKLGRERELRLGDLTPVRDWGFAGDYVEAIWRMLQRDEPGDFVVATGAGHSIADFARTAFAHVGLDWREHVVSDDAFRRPADSAQQVGDASKAARELGWTPRIDFDALVAMMVDADLERLGG
jgi:GDPmannose 4,6-dehydratase